MARQTLQIGYLEEQQKPELHFQKGCGRHLEELHVKEPYLTIFVVQPVCLIGDL